MFEFLEFNERAGLQPYLCVNFDEDMPGLLEYLYGTSSTPWGAQRIADGHPAPYSPEIVFVCSNEEPQQQCSGKPPGPVLPPAEQGYPCYVKAFKSWAASTKAAGQSLGVWPLTVGVALDSGAGRYFAPGNEDHYRGGATEMIEAIVAADLGPVVWDQHGDGGVAAGWNDGRAWRSILSDVPASPASMEALTKKAGHWVKTIMLEENGGGDGLSRALGHVSNSLTFQRFGHQMIAQSAAGIFWPGKQGATNGDFQIKFLADRIVKAPFWYSQLMLSESHQPNIVGGYHTTPSQPHACNLHPGGADCATANGHWADWMAAVSDDGKTLVIRTENPNPVDVNLTAAIAGGPWATTVAVRTLAGPGLGAMNDFETPDAVVPKNATASLTGGGKVLAYTLPPFSFVVLTLLKKDQST